MNATMSRFASLAARSTSTPLTSGIRMSESSRSIAVALQDVDRLRPVRGHRHVVAVAPKHDAQHLPHRRLVVDDEDPRLGGRLGGSRASSALALPSMDASCDHAP